MRAILQNLTKNTLKSAIFERIKYAISQNAVVKQSRYDSV